MTLPFLYQLQDAKYSSLSSADFRIAVVDPDDSQMSAGQVQALNASGKQLLAYTSIGEAEEYRDYWSDGGWGSNPPSFVLAENPDWSGNYRVKFWEPEWKQIIMQRVDAAVALGYDGVYLDIVDAYTVSQVKNAYPGSDADLRQAMIDFVIEISEYAKAKQPGFMVVPQNAVGLLAANENNASGGANDAYLRAIDGLGVEDLWYDGNSSASWTRWDLEYIQHAINADKFVLATSYPTDPAKQAAFVASALDAGLIPFATDRDLTGEIPAANAGTDRALNGRDINTPWASNDDGGAGSGDAGTGSGDQDAGSGDAGSGSGGQDAGSDGAGSGSDGQDAGSGSGDAGEETGDAGSGSGSGSDGAGAGSDDQDTDADDDEEENGDSGSGSGPEPDAFVPTHLGDHGDNSMRGGWGDDVMLGLGGDDRSRGRSGDDVLLGGAGDDRLSGGRGEDRLFGGDGRDMLSGGSGDDVLSGGEGRNHLYGGSGEDSFLFVASELGRDVVRDFQSHVDTLTFVGFDPATLLDHAEQKGSDVVFDFGDGESIVVLNASLNHLVDDISII